MTKICPLTGKMPKSGNNRSHSLRATKRRFLPNLQTKRILDPATGQRVTLRLSTKALRTLVKESRK